jgi:hypothetical protein
LNNDLPGLDRLLKQKKNANKVVVWNQGSSM